MEVVRVAIPSDANYAVGLLVTAGSIAMHASRNIQLEITVLDGGVTESQYKYLRQRLEKLHPLVSVKSAKIQQESFSRFPEWHGNRMAYARFLIPDLMPDADFVIYTDSDMLWLADVAELWKKKSENIALWAVHDAYAGDAGARAWQEKYGFTFDSRHYFCGGLQFINLRLFREREYMRRAFEALLKYPGARFADQDALNLVVGSEVAILDEKWMKFTHEVSSRDMNSQVVLHYSNELPWRRTQKWDALTDTIMIWHRYHALICEISLWKSLRMFFSSGEIILRRLLAVVVSNRYIGDIVLLILRKLGLNGLSKDLSYWCRRVRM